MSKGDRVKITARADRGLNVAKPPPPFFLKFEMFFHLENDS